MNSARELAEKIADLVGGCTEIDIKNVESLLGEAMQERENCVVCNRAKWDLTILEFFEWANRIRQLPEFPECYSAFRLDKKKKEG